ncbi:MAG: copper resistance protein CopC/CopD [Gemmatimonadetes bacterium]|nr:copper resistance protein CopC/CopD [Gemmatimonadota bacterium]
MSRPVDRAIGERTGGRAAGGRRPARIALLLLLILAFAPTAGHAHQRLVRSEPARETALDAAPREIRFFFVEPIELTFTSVELLGPEGTNVPLGELRLHPDSANVLIAPIAAPLPREGGYVVRWATASRDGHPVRGEFTFTIAPGAAGLAPDPAVAEPAVTERAAPSAIAPPAALPTFTAESPAYVALRWVMYLALVGVLGAVVFALVVLGLVRRREPGSELTDPARRHAAGVGLAFAVVLFLAALARLYAQSLAMHGSAAALDGSRVAAMLSQTLWGWGWILQVGAAVIAALGFLLARGGAGGGWALAALAALVLSVTPALSGHAGAMTGPIGSAAVVADSVHVLAAGGWLGSLLVLLIAGIPAAMRLGTGRRSAGVATLVQAFSPTALLFAGLLVLTGVFAAFVHSGSFFALIASDYGRLLLLKLGIFLLVFATGAYNYLRVRPALGDEVGTHRLRRSATVELAMGAAVLLVTSVLVATARPYEEHEMEMAIPSHAEAEHEV